MGKKKDIRGLSIKNWKVVAILLATVILLLGALTLGLYLGGFRYLQVSYLIAPENTAETVTFMGFINKDGSIKKGNISCTGDKKGSVTALDDGQYKIVYSEGDVYVGQMDGLQRSGKGEMTYAGGDHYVGDFFADRIHGTGVFTYADGDVYEGSFAGGKKSGQGKYTWVFADGTSGAVYEGAFKNDKRNGYGVFTATDGTVYKGYFVNDRREDSTAEVLIPTAAGTDRYYGGYANDVRQGFGYYFYATGDVYIGQFENNKPHGKGAIYFIGGGSYKGTFEQGNISKDDAEEIPESEVKDDLEDLDPDKNPFDPVLPVSPSVSDESKPDGSASQEPTVSEEPTVSQEGELSPSTEENQGEESDAQ
ncbi:MAG: hypothetical protein J6M12_07355 [Clostridia bacterium]|nr:hypothetical protein [Clostridia bacterium]